MQHIDRTKIEEIPIIIDADQSWKDNYLRQLREARETGKPLSEIINADEHRVSMRRLK